MENSEALQFFSATNGFEGAEFHHVGLATTSIDRENNFFNMLGYRPDGSEFVDSRQGVRGKFIVGSGPRIELLENLPGSETLNPWLRRGSRLYHLAYVVPDLREAARSAKDRGAITLSEPVPSVAFSGRPICFLIFSNRIVIELIQKQLRGG